MTGYSSLCLLRWGPLFIPRVISRLDPLMLWVCNIGDERTPNIKEIVMVLL